MDEDKIDVAIRPVLPSRATGAPSGRDPILGLEPMLPPVDRSRKPRKKKSQALPPLEIERVLGDNKRNMKKAATTKRRRTGWARKSAIAAVDRNIKTTKNPNRPLELKNQMLALLDVVKSLGKDELAAFADTTTIMRDMSKTGRKRVLDALANVYG